MRDGQRLLFILLGLFALASWSGRGPSAAPKRSGPALTLIDLPSSKAFKVCYQAHLSARWPQFTDELKIALAHWGLYIGKTLTLELTAAVFPTHAGPPQQALVHYQEHHCEGADLVVAEHDLKGPAAQVLKEPSLGSALLIQRESDQFNWLTLAQAQGPHAVHHIHEAMRARDQFFVKSKQSDHLLFSALLQQTRTLWGLPPHISFGAPETEIFNRIFLLDEEIALIRDLAHERGLRPLSFSLPPAGAPLPYKVLVSKKTKSELVLKFAINKNTSLNAVLELKIFDENGEYNTLEAEIKASALESAHYEVIELELDPRWQLTSALLLTEQGEEILIDLEVTTHLASY